MKHLSVYHVVYDKHLANISFSVFTKPRGGIFANPGWGDDCGAGEEGMEKTALASIDPESYCFPGAESSFMLTFAGQSLHCWFPYEFQMRPWAAWPWAILDSQREPAKLELTVSWRSQALGNGSYTQDPDCLTAPWPLCLPTKLPDDWLPVHGQQSNVGLRCWAADVIPIGKKIQTWDELP